MLCIGKGSVYDGGSIGAPGTMMSTFSRLVQLIDSDDFTRNELVRSIYDGLRLLIAFVQHYILLSENVETSEHDSHIRHQMIYERNLSIHMLDVNRDLEMNPDKNYFDMATGIPTNTQTLKLMTIIKVIFCRLELCVLEAGV